MIAHCDKLPSSSFLYRQPLWYSTIPDAAQCAGGSSEDKCTVKFSVCGPLPPNTCMGTSDSTAFCQVITNSVPGSEHDTGKQTLIVNEASKYYFKGVVVMLATIYVDGILHNYICT